MYAQQIERLSLHLIPEWGIRGHILFTFGPRSGVLVTSSHLIARSGVILYIGPRSSSFRHIWSRSGIFGYTWIRSRERSYSISLHCESTKPGRRNSISPQGKVSQVHVPRPTVIIAGRPHRGTSDGEEGFLEGFQFCVSLTGDWWKFVSVTLK